MLQQMATPRVVANKQMYLTSQATNVQWIDFGLMVVLQWTTTLRVVARLRTSTSTSTKMKDKGLRTSDFKRQREKRDLEPKGKSY